MAVEEEVARERDTGDGHCCVFILAALLAANRGAGDRLPAIGTPDLPQQSVAFTEIKPIAPWVNDKSQNGGYEVFDETAFPTFAIAIHNPTQSTVAIHGADFVIDSARTIRGQPATTAMFAAMNHQGHLSAWIMTGQAGERVRIPIALTLEPGNARHFTVWFRSTAGPIDGTLLIEGHLRLDGNLASSPPLKVVTDGIRSSGQEQASATHVEPNARNGGEYSTFPATPFNAPGMSSSAIQASPAAE